MALNLFLVILIIGLIAFPKLFLAAIFGGIAVAFIVVAAFALLSALFAILNDRVNRRR